MSTKQSHAIKRNRFPKKFLPQLKATVSILALGIGAMGIGSPVWAGCSGDTVFSTSVGQQNNSLWLCSFSVTNSGLISGEAAGINNGGGIIDTLTNSGTISGSTYDGIYNSGTIGTLNNTNSGSILGSSSAIYNRLGTIELLTNSGTISGSGGDGVYNTGTIGTLTNTQSGSISGSYGYGIFNAGTIVTLNNAQGNSGALALTYYGKLPTHYNIIVSTTSSYGKLAVTSMTGSMAFGIYAGGVTGVPASILSAYKYIDVLQGFSTLINVTGITGRFTGGYSYSLVAGSSPSSWDLLVTGGPADGSSGGGSAPPALPEVTSGTSIGLSSIGVTASPVLAGGTLVLTQDQRSSQAFSILGAGSTITSPSMGAAQLSGVLSGAGSLTFNGVGTTVLSGANTYAGSTTVASGTLSLLDGMLGSGAVYVASGAQFGGTGIIGGALTVAGLLKPGHSPGYLVTQANVTMTNGSVYQQDIAGITQASTASPVGTTGYYSYLNVGGQLVINSGATLMPRLSNLFSATESGYGSTPYTPVLGDQFRFATATGGIVGKFGNLTQPAELTAGTQFLPFYNMAGSNSIDLALIPKSYASTLSSANANTRSVSGALDKMVLATQLGVSTSTQDQLLYATSAQNTSSLPSYVQSLAGEIYPATVAVVTQATQRVQQAVMSRLGDTVSAPMLAGGVNPVANSVNHIAIAGQPPMANVSSNPSVNPNATINNAALNNGTAWGEIAYQRGNRFGDANASGFSSNLYQLVFGVDGYSEHGIKLGGGLALSNTNVTASQGTGTVQQGSLFLYGKLPIDAFLLDGMASYGMNTTDHSRGDVTGLSSGLSTKGVKGNDALVSLGLSRPIDLDNLRITPYVRGTWQMVNQSTFTEGSSPAALSIDGYNGNGVRGVLGAALGSKAINPLNERYTYRVNIGVGADSSNLINPTLNASLAGMPTSITTPQAGSTFVQAGLSGTVKLAENAYAYAGVSGEFRSGSTLGNVNVGVRVQF